MLEVSQLDKRFPKAKSPALRGVSFEVGEGRICGLLGHNGAGKSTALGIILGMVHPDAGSVRIDGLSVQGQREQAVARIGAIFETPVFYEYLSGWQNLRLLSAYSGGVPRRLLEETVAWVGLEKRIRDKVGAYSHGMRQRLALAQALLPRPKLLVLDEPTDGLDPEGLVEFRSQVLELRRELGITVLLSSHLLSEVELLCDEVVILHGGEKVHEGPVGGVEEERRFFRIESDNPEETARLCAELGGEPREGGALFPAAADAAELLAGLVGGGAKVSRFSREEASLEDFYLRISRERRVGGPQLGDRAQSGDQPECGEEAPAEA